MMLAAWSVLRTATIKNMQASRAQMTAAMRATASLFFFVGGLI
jgi:hypothetical protein